MWLNTASKNIGPYLARAKPSKMIRRPYLAVMEQAGLGWAFFVEGENQINAYFFYYDTHDVICWENVDIDRATKEFFDPEAI